LVVLIHEKLRFVWVFFVNCWLSNCTFPFLFELFYWLLIESVIAHCWLLIVDFVPIQIEWFCSVWMSNCTFSAYINSMLPDVFCFCAALSAFFPASVH
jgi:hypothetical protein